MEILDTTIRDGSYAVDFKFTCDDVCNIVEKSYKLGIKYIEIGHGLGIHASSKEHGVSLHTDEEYMDAARFAVPDAKLGLFCIPGIARLCDVRECKKHGMDFLRIGINVTDFKRVKEYVKTAKNCGLKVAVNYMKSYAVSPDFFANAALYAKNCGADCVYIVDSAGCMLPNDIVKYIEAVRNKCDVLLGFHGHNNMGLAVSNTVFCVKQNIDFIDCSFQGLGRSCGNASIEQVVMNLEKEGRVTNMDIPCVLEYGYAALRNIVDSGKLTNPLDYVCGYAGFHSSYLKHIYKCCMKEKVDPLRLIIEYSKRNIVNINYDELCKVAKHLPKDQDVNPYSFATFFSDVYDL